MGDKLDIFNDEHFSRIGNPTEFTEDQLDIFNDKHFSRYKKLNASPDTTEPDAFDDFGLTLDTQEECAKGMEDWDWSAKAPELIESERRQAEEEQRMKDEGWINIPGKCAHIVVGDTIKFTENVFDKQKPKERAIIGYRTNVVHVTKETYSDRLQNRLYFEVVESTGDDPLSKGQSTYRMRGSLAYSHELWRQKRDEQEREAAKAESNQLANHALERFMDPDKKTVRKTKKKKVDDKEFEYKPSECEQQWVESEWYQGIILDHKSDDKHGKWDPAAGWNSVSNSNDQILIGDIIRFVDGVFSGYYPKTKFAGTVTVVAEVTKIGKKYYHLQLINSYGINPYKKAFKVKTARLFYWGQTYRLLWKYENLRRFEFGREFSSTEEYLEYIKPECPEIKDDNEIEN